MIQHNDNMSRKLAMSPDMSYMLGISTIGTDEPSISVTTPKYEVIERFVHLAVSVLEIDPRKVVVKEEGDMKEALFYHSTVKRLFKKALEEREHIFKYKNEYSASYFAGLFDAKGSGSRKGVLTGTRDMTDIIVLTRLGFRINRNGKVQNANDFLSFIRPFSASL